MERVTEPSDPLELLAEPVVGDPVVMLECLLQEFVWMGFGKDQLLSLFNDPAYPFLVQLRRHLGADEVRRCVETLVRIIKAEEGGPGGKGAWDLAGNRFGPDSATDERATYLAGGFIRIEG